MNSKAGQLTSPFGSVMNKNFDKNSPCQIDQQISKRSLTGTKPTYNEHKKTWKKVFVDCKDQPYWWLLLVAVSAPWYRLQLQSLHMGYIKQCYFFAWLFSRAGETLYFVWPYFTSCHLAERPPQFSPPKMTKEQQCLRRHCHRPCYLVGYFRDYC